MQDTKLYVGNLNYATTQDGLKNLFSSYGEVKYVKIIEGKGFGFVEMGSANEAEQAKQELNGYEFEGRTLKVDTARPLKKREGGSSFGGDRGGRPFRSNNRY